MTLRRHMHMMRHIPSIYIKVHWPRLARIILIILGRR